MRWPGLVVVVVVSLSPGFAACSGAHEDELVLSGRIQLDPDTAAPVANAFVRVTDSNKSRRCFVTACDGTFSVRASDAPSLVLPITEVSVERVDAPREPAGLTRTVVARRMHGRIDQQRSCNGCHFRGVALFRRAEDVPAELRDLATTCSPSSEMRCPEDRFFDDELELIRDSTTYRGRVHAAFVRRCGSSSCHGGEGEELAKLAPDGVAVMEKARGRSNHGGGQVVSDGDFADQCFADWLGVPRAPSRVKVTHADACRRAAE